MDSSQPESSTQDGRMSSSLFPIQASVILHKVSFSTSKIHKDGINLSYNSQAILSGDETLNQKPISTLQHLYKKFWVQRGNHFSLDFNISFDQSVTESECEALLQRLAGALARTKLWSGINLTSSVVRTGHYSLSVFLSYDEDSIACSGNHGKAISGYTSRLIPPVGIATLELHRVVVDLDLERLTGQTEFTSIEEEDEYAFPDAAFHLIEGVFRHDLLGITKQGRPKRYEVEPSIKLPEICPAMFSPGHLKAMNEHSNIIPNITGSLTRITRRARSRTFSGHDTKQIRQQLWNLAQCQLFNAKAVSKLPFLEDRPEELGPKTRKEKLEMSRKALGMYLLDDDDNDEGFQDVESLMDDGSGYDVSQKSMDGVLGFEDMQDMDEVEDGALFVEIDDGDVDMLDDFDDLTLPVLARSDIDDERRVLIFSDL